LVVHRVPATHQRGEHPPGAQGRAGGAHRAVKPLDPRLVRYARATAGHLGVTAGLGVAAALLVIAQAELLSSGIAGVVADGGRTRALTGVLGWLALVVAGRAALAWAQDAAAHRAASRVKS